MPPGYKDMQKDETGDPTRRYGDLILWMEILKKAKDDQHSVIFVTDDQKEDWWLSHDGKTISPRPELIKEFTEATGKPCYIYQPEAFLKFSAKYAKQTVPEPAITEVRELRLDDQHRRITALQGRVQAIVERNNLTLHLQELTLSLAENATAIKSREEDLRSLNQKVQSQDPVIITPEEQLKFAELKTSLSTLLSKRDNLLQHKEHATHALELNTRLLNDLERLTQ